MEVVLCLYLWVVVEDISEERVAALVLRRLVIAVVLFAIIAVGSVVTKASTTAADLRPLTDEERAAALDVAVSATVRVVATGCRGRTIGSGFLLDGALITNSHIVGGGNRLAADRIGPSGLVSSVEFAVTNDAPRIDLARAVPSASASPGPAAGVELPSLVVATAPPERGEPVLLVGYAGGRDLAVLEAVVHHRVDGGAYGSTGEVLLLSRPTVEGFSGGPVVNRDGEVVGVLRATDVSTGLSIATPASLLVDVHGSIADVPEETRC